MKVPGYERLHGDLIDGFSRNERPKDKHPASRLMGDKPLIFHDSEQRLRGLVVRPLLLRMSIDHVVDSTFFQIPQDLKSLISAVVGTVSFGFPPAVPDGLFRIGTSLEFVLTV